MASASHIVFGRMAEESLMGDGLARQQESRAKTLSGTGWLLRVDAVNTLLMVQGAVGALQPPSTCQHPHLQAGGAHSCPLQPPQLCTQGVALNE